MRVLDWSQELTLQYDYYWAIQTIHLSFMLCHVAESGQLEWRQVFNGLEQPCVTLHLEEKHQQIKW